MQKAKRRRTAALQNVFALGLVSSAAGATGFDPLPAFSLWPLVAIAVVFLFFSAVLSAAEAALFSLGSDQVESLERQGHHRILAAKVLLLSRDETLITLLLANYIANLALVACLLVVFFHVSTEHLLAGAALGGLLSAAAIVVFGEFLPRALGRCFNVAVALALARPIVGLTVLVAPLRWLVLGISNLLLGLRGSSSLERGMGDAEELRTLITADDLNGGLEEEERELISGVFELGSTCVGEIMTPRPKILAFCDETVHGEILGQLRRCKFRRVFVYRESLDQIRGVLHLKDVLLNPQTDYREMLRKPLVVPEGKKLMDLLREFRRQHVHLAVVCDEFGRTAGIVTLQDVLEQIIGEVAEEDRHTPEPIRRIGPSAWLVLGHTRVADLGESVGLALSDESGRTVAGFVAGRLGRIPAVDDSITEGEFTLTVERMAARRVAILRIERVARVTDNSAQEDLG